MIKDLPKDLVGMTEDDHHSGEEAVFEEEMDLPTLHNPNLHPQTVRHLGVHPGRIRVVHHLARKMVLKPRHLTRRNVAIPPKFMGLRHHLPPGAVVIPNLDPWAPEDIKRPHLIISMANLCL